MCRICLLMASCRTTNPIKAETGKYLWCHLGYQGCQNSTRFIFLSSCFLDSRIVYARRSTPTYSVLGRSKSCENSRTHHIVKANERTTECLGCLAGMRVPSSWFWDCDDDNDCYCRVATFYVTSDLSTRQRRLRSTRGEDLGGGSSLTWPYFTVRSTLTTRPNNRNNTWRRTFFSFIYYDIETTHSKISSCKRLHNKQIT
jgi:hypothetical protein